MSSVDQLKLVSSILESEGCDAAFADVEWAVKRIAELEAVAREVMAVHEDPNNQYDDNDIPQHLYKMARNALGYSR